MHSNARETAIEKVFQTLKQTHICTYYIQFLSFYRFIFLLEAVYHLEIKSNHNLNYLQLGIFDNCKILIKSTRILVKPQNLHLTRAEMP